jgi:hypothetical protein
LMLTSRGRGWGNQLVQACCWLDTALSAIADMSAAPVVGT